MISYQANVVLGHLSQRPRKSAELQRITGYSDVEIRQLIRELRLNGHPICSGQKGFWVWNGTDDSWEHTKNNIKSRAKQLMDLYRAMESIRGNDQVSFF